jgi:uncharacterized protein YbjT (DUF2867 family)
MKIVVIGGTGLIGAKTVALLRQDGHEVVAGSPHTGINTVTGEGPKEAVADTRGVIDLANSPSIEEKAALQFFETSGRKLLEAEGAANVPHHVALSIVGIDRTDNGYFRAKVAQEKLIEASGIPYTIVRSTQFLEFLRAIASSNADENRITLPPSCSSPSRRTMWLPSLPMWHWRPRDAASWRLPAQNGRRLTKLSPAI